MIYGVVRCVLRRLLPGRGNPKLSWSPGAYAGPEEELSPLYAFFRVANEGRNPVELVRLYLAPVGGEPLEEATPEGERPLPLSLAPGEATTFRLRAKRLARALAAAGHRGRPRVRLVAVDGCGGEHVLRFRYPVDEYLSLRDE